MERLVIVVVVGLVAVVVAAVVQRRQPATAPADTDYHISTQLHRGDFERPDAPWLVVLFTSATCRSCQGMWDKARHLESDVVAVQQIEVTEAKEIHERYRIDGIPTTLVADAEGVVQRSFMGPATATDLWAAVAELREPGTIPDDCHE
ncbi:MAG: thioredoxin domain-containing protein [Acidimicrobiales bacterium]|nr:thioredoxin domain-containing protein [Acidimicrobiales bacterium]